MYMVSLLDFINYISQMDDIQDVSARTFGRKVDLLAPGVGCPTAPTTPPPGHKPDVIERRSRCGIACCRCVVVQVGAVRVSLSVWLMVVVSWHLSCVMVYDTVLPAQTRTGVQTVPRHPRLVCHLTFLLAPFHSFCF